MTYRFTVRLLQPKSPHKIMCKLTLELTADIPQIIYGSKQTAHYRSNKFVTMILEFFIIDLIHLS